MVLGAGILFVIGGNNRPPISILNIGMRGTGIVAIAFICVAVMYPGSRLPWGVVMALFYVMVTAQSVVVPPIMALFIEPWKKGISVDFQSHSHCNFSSFLVPRPFCSAYFFYSAYPFCSATRLWPCEWSHELRPIGFVGRTRHRSHGAWVGR